MRELTLAALMLGAAIALSPGIAKPSLRLRADEVIE